MISSQPKDAAYTPLGQLQQHWKVGLLHSEKAPQGTPQSHVLSLREFQSNGACPDHMHILSVETSNKYQERARTGEESGRRAMNRKIWRDRVNYTGDKWWLLVVCLRSSMNGFRVTLEHTMVFIDVCDEAPHPLDRFTSVRVGKGDAWEKMCWEIKPSREYWDEDYWEKVKDYGSGCSAIRPGWALIYGPRPGFFKSRGRAWNLPWKEQKGGGRG